MTLQEIRDAFLMRYQRISKQLNQKVDIIGDAEIAWYISLAQQDIQRRLSVVESSVDITLGSETNLYALPATFGKQKHAYISDLLLKEVPIKEAEQEIAIGNTGDFYAIKISGHIPYVFCPVTSGTLTIVYYPDLSYYQPSLGSSQVWGTFTGAVYSGNPILPNRYSIAIITNMLSQIFPDYLALYEKELKSLRESRQFSSTDTLGYILGGIDDKETYSASGSSSTTTTVSALDVPSKRMRIIADDTGGYTIEYSNGWTTTPTVVNNISTIVITSSDSEFTNFVHVAINNHDFGWSMTSSTITITASPTSSWGEVEIIIDIY